MSVNHLCSQQVEKESAMKDKPIVGTLLALLITGIAGAFGWALTPDDAAGLVIFSALAGLPASVQVGLLVVLGLLVTVPAIAPYTPWTWDDHTIKYRSKAMALIGVVWNSLAGNGGRASNAEPATKRK